MFILLIDGGSLQRKANKRIKRERGVKEEYREACVCVNETI